MQQQLGGGQTA